MSAAINRAAGEGRDGRPARQVTSSTGSPHIPPGVGDHGTRSHDRQPPNGSARLLNWERDTFHHSALDALDAHVAVLDATGTILEVNQAWRRFARANCLKEGTGEAGANYLAACDRATGVNSDEAAVVAAGIRSVIDGTATEFALTYPCHCPTEKRWFTVRVGRFEGADGVRVVVAHENVSGIMAVEESLRESERQYRLLFESNPFPMWVYDRETLAFLAVNDAAVAKYGYTRAEFLGRTIKDVRPPEDVPALIENVTSAPDGYEDAGVWRHRLKDGRVIRVRVTSHTIEFDGRAAKLVSVLDVTDQLQAMEALAESEERLRLALLAGNMGTYDWDIPSNKVVWSDSHYTLFGYPPGDRFPVEFHHFSDRLHPDDRPQIEQEIEAAKRERRPYVNECRLLLPDGTVRWVLGCGEFKYDAAGRAVRMLGTAIDVTARKQAEMELRVRDRAIRAVSEGIVITDPTLPDNPIVYASPGFERITGYPPGETLGRNCRFLHGRDTDRSEVERMRQAIARGEAYTGEQVCYRRDGTLFWVGLSFTPVRDEAGRLIQFVGVLSDVTARRSLEDQLRQSQKMEAIGQLAGGVAHDFNNLLAVINGYSELALLRTPADHPLHDGLVGIRDAGERAAGLTSRLLAFSRRAIVCPRTVDLNDLIGPIAEMLRRLIGENIALKTVLTATPCPVRIDPGQFEQAVINLAVNARDAMPGGGELTIETSGPAAPPAEGNLPPGRYVRLTVTDTGCGMSAEVKAHVFEPFFTTKGPGKGTGLGLAMVYGFVQQAGGHIQVTSAVDRGTAFTLLLPEVPAGAGPDGNTVVRPAAAHGTETVLLAEDEDGVRRMARLALEMHGYTVLEAADGLEGRTLALTHPGPIHLLLTDVIMPGLGGRELADSVRAARPDVRVLFASGYTDDELVRHGVAESAEAFLHKPFTPTVLAAKVRKVLDAPTPAASD